MFRGLSLFLVTINILSCENSFLKSPLFGSRSSSGLTSLSLVSNLTNFRFYKSLNTLSPLNVYPILAASGNPQAIAASTANAGTAYDSKQVSNTLWNLLSIARFLLCK